MPTDLHTATAHSGLLASSSDLASWWHWPTWMTTPCVTQSLSRLQDVLLVLTVPLQAFFWLFFLTLTFEYWQMLINHKMENTKFTWKQSRRLSLNQVIHVKIAQWAKCLLCQNEDLSSDSRDPHKNL